MNVNTEIVATDFNTLKSQIIKSRSMTPVAKGWAGLILFKVENKITLEPAELRFYEELPYFLSRANKIERRYSK